MSKRKATPPLETTDHNKNGQPTPSPPHPLGWKIPDENNKWLKIPDKAFIFGGILRNCCGDIDKDIIDNKNKQQFISFYDLSDVCNARKVCKSMRAFWVQLLWGRSVPLFVQAGGHMTIRKAVEVIGQMKLIRELSPSYSLSLIDDEDRVDDNVWYQQKTELIFY